MGLIDKEKVTQGVGKAVDATNKAADKVTEFVKEKEIDKKVNDVVNKTEDFIKEKELDKKAASAVSAVGSGMKKIGSKLEERFKN